MQEEVCTVETHQSENQSMNCLHKYLVTGLAALSTVLGTASEMRQAPKPSFPVSRQALNASIPCGF